MKNFGGKLITIALVALQIGLGIKSFFVLKQLFANKVETLISPTDQAIVIAFMVATIIVSLLLVLFAMQKEEKQIKPEVELVTKSEIKDRTEQKIIKEEEKKRIQALNDKKKVIVSDLMKDLNLNEGLQKYSEKVLINISKQFNIMQGLFFLKDPQDKVYRKVGTYAYYSEEELREFTEDIGLSGQVAANKKLLNISNIPDKYITVLSGLGQSSPANLVIFPILKNNESIGIIELASFVKFDSFAEEVFMEFSLMIGNQLADINKEIASTEN